jgi:adenosylmethionine-8-amino-7-oxononanoate aminotransferase
LILDEVAVGFGRTGTLFACEQEGVSPDFLCLAKGLTAGYLPMAATLTTPRVWNAFLGTHADRRTFFHGHTYGGNPLAAAVGLASLSVRRRVAATARMRSLRLARWPDAGLLSPRPSAVGGPGRRERVAPSPIDPTPPKG